MNELTYVTMPRNCCSCLTFLGALMAWMLLILSGSILTPSRQRMCPKYLTSLRPNLHLSLFRTRPASQHLWSTFYKVWLCSSSVSEWIRMSSITTITFFISPKILSVAAWKTSEAQAMPNGILRNL